MLRKLFQVFIPVWFGICPSRGRSCFVQDPRLYSIPLWIQRFIHRRSEFHDGRTRAARVRKSGRRSRQGQILVRRFDFWSFLKVVMLIKVEFSSHYDKQRGNAVAILYDWGLIVIVQSFKTAEPCMTAYEQKQNELQYMQIIIWIPGCDDLKFLVIPKNCLKCLVFRCREATADSGGRVVRSEDRLSGTGKPNPTSQTGILSNKNKIWLFCILMISVSSGIKINFLGNI